MKIAHFLPMIALLFGNSALALAQLAIQVPPITPPLEANEETSTPVGGGFSVSGSSGTITVELSVKHGNLAVSDIGTLKGANGSEKITLEGIETAINNALKELSYKGKKDFFGEETISLVVKDETSRTSGGATITVKNINDPPENLLPPSLTVNEDTISNLEHISVTDPDGNADIQSVQLTVTKGTIKVFEQDEITLSSKSREKSLTISSGKDLKRFNDTLKTLDYKGDDNFSGRDTLTILSVDKSAAQDSDTIDITVKNVVAECDWSQSGKEVVMGDLGKNVSVGSLVSYSLVQYNLADKKSSFNAKSLGAGLSFRLYADEDLKRFGEVYLPGKAANGPLGIKDIPRGCRAQSVDLLEQPNKISPWVSISPTMYAFQGANEDKFGVQFALNFGFLNDIFNVGVGYNLSGENAGEWFILAGPSFGFKF